MCSIEIAEGILVPYLTSHPTQYKSDFFFFFAVGLLPMPVCLHREATWVPKRKTYRATSSR